MVVILLLLVIHFAMQGQNLRYHLRQVLYCKAVFSIIHSFYILVCRKKKNAVPVNSVGSTKI